MNKIHLNSRWPWIRHRFIFLLAMLFFLLVVTPFLEGFARLRFLFNAFLTAVLISAVYALSQKIRNLAIAALLAIPMLISIWTQYFVQSQAIFLIGRICGASFIAFTISYFAKYIPGTRRYQRYHRRCGRGLYAICPDVVIFIWRAGTCPAWLFCDIGGTDTGGAKYFTLL
jgi:hypothetical protein